jgi:2-methylcitrate dehydratase PrpD
VRQPPYSFKLVGQPWRIGENPRVDAQFSAQSCVANAIVRRSSRLAHFRPEQIVDAQVQQLIPRVRIEGVAAMDPRGHTAVDVVLHTIDGRHFERGLDIAPGFPGNDLSDAQQRSRFDDCMAYAPRPLPRVLQFLDAVQHLGELKNARELAGMLVA